jgi:MFS family permease
VTTPALFSPLRHRDYALMMGAFTTSMIGTWAYNVGLGVWLIQETGDAGWVTVAIVARFLPSLLVSAYAGVVAERFERVRLMMRLDILLVLVMVALAAAMAVHAPPYVVVAIAVASSVAGTFYEPAAAATTPLLVPERELAAANALRNTVDNICVVAGPALGALTLLLGEPWIAVAANAATFAVSAVLVALVRTRSEPVDVTEGGEAGPLRQMAVGIRAIAGSGSVATLVAFSVVATMVFGIDSVLFIEMSRELLGTGAEGYGYLLAGLGVGGLLAAPLVTRLERQPRLGTIIWLGMAGYCLPTLLLLVVDQPVWAFFVQVFRGGSTLVVDVLAVTALQRTLSGDLLGRVFGAFEGLMTLAILLGSLVVPVGLALVGIDGVIVFSGLVIPLLCLAGLPWLRRLDRESTARRAELAPRLALLSRAGLLERAPAGVLDELAASASAHEVTAGDTVVHEGEAADAFYLVESGRFRVHARGELEREEEIREVGPGDYFGEIGLIEGVPRTASVTAASDGRLLRVEGETFIDALTSQRPATALLDAASLRLQRTHPSRSLTHQGLSQHD